MSPLSTPSERGAELLSRSDMSSRFALVRALALVAVFALCFAAGRALGEDEQPARKQPATQRPTLALGSYTLPPAPALPDLRAVPRKPEPKPAPAAPAAPAPAPPPVEAPPTTQAAPTPAPSEPPPPESPPPDTSPPEPAPAPDPAPEPAPRPSPDAAPGAGGSGYYEDDGGRN